MQFNRIYVENAHGRSLSRDNLQLDCHNIDGLAVGVNRVDFLAAARDTAWFVSTAPANRSVQHTQIGPNCSKKAQNDASGNAPSVKAW